MSGIEPYPFEQDIEPEYRDRIKISDIPENLKTPYFTSAYSSLLPDVVTRDCCYNIGSNKSRWIDLYESVYIFCCQNSIPNIVFLWSNTVYKHYRINDYNWRRHFTIPTKDILLSSFLVGYQLLIAKSLHSTLKEYPQIKTIQVFANSNQEYDKVSESRVIPTFNYDNFPCFDIVKEQNINLYIEAGHSVNITKNNEVEYMIKLIRYSTAHSAKGTIFEVSASRSIDFQTTINNLNYNIINSVRNSKFRSEQREMSKLLIKPVFKRNSLLDDIGTLIMFVNNLRNFPDVFEFFGIVLDIKSIQGNYNNIYYYLKEIIKHCNVEAILISNRWLETLDDYNFIFLYKTCQLSQLMNIQIIITI